MNLLKNLTLIKIIMIALVTPALAQKPMPSLAANRPKLIVAILIDQFGSDYLNRFEKRFLPAFQKIRS